MSFPRTSACPLAVTALAAALVVAPAGGQQPAGSTGEAWRIIALPQSSQVLARDGSLIGEIGRQIRTNVSLRSLPRYVGQAFIAVEDQRFYRHNGVDIVGIGGAALDALRGDARGASTITQQLVGNMHPDVVDRRDRGPERKIREQRAALEMERHYNKEQILEAYINTINYGHGWYGIEAAARHYFGKPASRLTLGEAASLASLPKSPVLYDPARYPARNRERRNLVLSLMAEQGYITRAQAAEAQAEPVRTVPNAGYAAPSSYYVDVVRVQAERAGVPVSQGGYRIHTTLDPALQQSAVTALKNGLAAVEARPGYRHPTYTDSAARRTANGTSYLQGMVVAMDPATGDVRALVGGRDYTQSPYNRAVSAQRQPGSAIKPLVYSAAIGSGQITAASIVYDTALTIPLDNGRLYRPGNADSRFLGAMTLRDALVQSRNPVAVQLGQQIGIDTVAALARRMGISTPIYRGPASAIGASALQPLDLVQSYTAFANLGAAVEPRFLARIDDRAGRTVYGGRAPQFSSAIDAGTAFIVRDMMRDVVERGTATSVRRLVPASVPVAGKTGTTNDNSDVWFVGMTPDLVAGVWLGFDQPKTITPGAARGRALAAPIWGRMVADYYRGRTPGRWTPPAGVVTAEIDQSTGLAADSLTPPNLRRTEYFLAGTEPGAGQFDPWAVFRYGPIGF